MYDLKPVRLSKRSNYVKFTDEIEAGAERAAPSRPAPYARSSSPTAPTRRRSSSARPATSPRRVKAAGKPVELLVGEGYNHFEMLETLANPYGLLGRAVLEQMRLAPA